MKALFIFTIYLSLCLSLRFGGYRNGVKLIKTVVSRFSTTRLHAKAAKVSEVFYCTECGVEHVKWVGRCTSCGEWNCVKEMRVSKLNTKQGPLDPRNTGGALPTWLPQSDQSGTLIKLKDIDTSYTSFKHSVQSKELNRVLGGGLVRGSVILLAGEPGIGKSTLLIQLATDLTTNKRGSVVYISGEENPQQVAARASRLGLSMEDIYVMCATDADHAVQTITDKFMVEGSSPPVLVIVDSVQTMRSSASSSAAGSVGQIRDSTALFVQLAKLTGSAVLLAGHVTKSGEVAGPRILEHMVDTVLYMEGSETSEHRILRAVKNRFGSASEVGVFSMTDRGMLDVDNPSALFLSPHSDDPIKAQQGREGAAVAVLMEGSRPLLSEIQSLVSTRPEFTTGSSSGNSNSNGNTRTAPARRTSDGFPLQRLQLICAVLEKYLSLLLYNKDVYINIIGGLKVTEPSSDLAVAVSIISSCLEENIHMKTAFIGEIGLDGELRGGKRMEERIREAQKMGFNRIIVPKSGFKSKTSDKQAGLKANSIASSTSSAASGGGIIECKNLYDVIEHAFINPTLGKAFREKYQQRRSKIRSRGGSGGIKGKGVGGYRYAPPSLPLYRQEGEGDGTDDYGSSSNDDTATANDQRESDDDHNNNYY